MNSAPHSPAAPMQRCDILIIGAGPAGMAAALAAAPSGAAIVLVDDNPAPGGQIWRDGPGAHLPPLARTHRERLAGAANVRVLTGTRVVGLGGGAHAQAYVNATVGGRTGSRCVWPHQHWQCAAATPDLQRTRDHPAPCGCRAALAHLHVRATGPRQELGQALQALQRL